MDGLLVAARFAHFAAATSLFGLCLFAALAWPVRRRLLIGLAAATFILSEVWFLASAASMGGGTLTRDLLETVAAQTAIGRAAMATSGLSVALVAILAWGRVPVLAAAVSALLVASLALSGHTQSHEGAQRLIHMAADAVHLMGAGAWLGGLIALGMMLRSTDEDKVRRVAAFSRVGYLAVAALVLSGVVNAALILPSPAALASTLYGRLLLAKIALFGGMLMLALYNRFRITPDLPGVAAVARLRSNALIEQGLGATILAIVSLIGTLDPAA
jgi:putative copper resistance protein D